MTQAELDALSRTQMKGDTQKAMRDCLVRMDELNDSFYRQVFAEFPELPAFAKSIKAIELDDCGHDHDHEEKQVSDYSNSQTAAIVAKFRRQFGDAKTSRLLDIAENIARQMILDINPSPASAMGDGYSRTIRDAYQWAHKKQSATKIPAALRNTVAMPAFPLVINYGGEFEREVWARGYDLVTSKLTKNLLPEAMQTISNGLSTGQTWQQIGEQLRFRYGASRYHWVRLVRSEMGQAAHRASLEQYKLVPKLKGKWSTSSMGETCPICLALDGNIYPLDKVPGLPHPQCRCVVVPTFGG